MDNGIRGNITDILQEHVIKIQPKGTSMYPLIIPGRDYAVIEKSDGSNLKKSDVVLYRRSDNMMVLHRICRIKDDQIYTIGDNQIKVEGPLSMNQVRGRMIAVIRDGHEISVDNIFYRMLFYLWILLIPVRQPLRLIASGLRKSLRR